MAQLSYCSRCMSGPYCTVDMCHSLVCVLCFKLFFCYFSIHRTAAVHVLARMDHSDKGTDHPNEDKVVAFLLYLDHWYMYFL